MCNCSNELENQFFREIKMVGNNKEEIRIEERIIVWLFVLISVPIMLMMEILDFFKNCFDKEHREIHKIKVLQNRSLEEENKKERTRGFFEKFLGGIIDINPGEYYDY